MELARHTNNDWFFFKKNQKNRHNKKIYKNIYNIYIYVHLYILYIAFIFACITELSKAKQSNAS